MMKEIFANKKGNLPLSIVPFPAFDLCLPHHMPWPNLFAMSMPEIVNCL